MVRIQMQTMIVSESQPSRIMHANIRMTMILIKNTTPFRRKVIFMIFRARSANTESKSDATVANNATTPKIMLI